MSAQTPTVPRSASLEQRETTVCCRIRSWLEILAQQRAARRKKYALQREKFYGLDNSSITYGIKQIHNLLGGPLLHSFQRNRKELGLARRDTWCVDNVAAVGSGRACCGVLALQFGVVETSDKFQQVDVANQKCNRLYCSYCRTPSVRLENKGILIATTTNCSGGGVNL